MIGWLRGTLLARLPDGELLLDVGGVGYRLSVPAPLLASVGSSPASTTGHDELALYVHTHVREDAIVLYGFATLEERRCFEALLGCHGVGPSLALAIVSALSPPDLVRAVMEEDLEVLCAVPGVGRKTAARLVLDLRSRLAVPELSESPTPGSTVAAGPRRDVRAALTELGYGTDEIRLALSAVPEEGPAEDLLRQALRQLAAAR